MVRITKRGLSEAVIAERSLDPGVNVEYTLTAAAGDKSLKFGVVVKVNGAYYQVANDAGKVQTYGDVDDVVKMLAIYAPSNDGTYQLTVVTGDQLFTNIPTDMVAWAAAQVTKLTAAKTDQQAAVVALDAQLALMVGWETGNAKQAAKKAEITAQKSAIVADIAAISAIIDRLS